MDLAKVKALCEAATPGPWWREYIDDDDGPESNRIEIHAPGEGNIIATRYCDGDPRAAVDMEFIIQARTLLSGATLVDHLALIDQIERRAAAEIEKAKQQRDDALLEVERLRGLLRRVRLQLSATTSLITHGTNCKRRPADESRNEP